LGGRSTACIAYGVRDSVEKKEFTTVELNPKIENFRPVMTTNIGNTRFLIPRRAMGFFYLADSKNLLGTCIFQSFEEDIRPILRDHYVITSLKSNLSRLGLLDLVTIKEGDFKDVARSGQFNFIFCDCTHTVSEIKQNLPAIRPLLSKGSILALHDITEKLRKNVLELVAFKHYILVNSMLVGFL